MQILHFIEPDYIVCGVCPFGAQDLALLAFEEAAGEIRKPELRIISKASEYEYSCDALAMRGFERLQVCTEKLLTCLYNK